MIKVHDGWRKLKLSDAGVPYSGLSGKNKSHFGSGKPYLPYMNIYLNSKINPDNLDYVEIRKGETQRKVSRGDVFFTASSETQDEVGISSVLLNDLGECYLNSFCFGWRLSSDDLLPEYLRYYFRSQVFRKQIHRLSQGATRYNLSKNELMKAYILYPSLYVQRRIADILQTWDTGIEKTEALIVAKERQFGWLCQRYFTPNNQVTSHWKQQMIGNFVTPRKERSTPLKDMPLYSLTIEDGVTAKSDRYNREFLVKDQGNKTYKVVYPKDIVFNPSNLRWGAIARSEVSHKVVISPIYEVFEILDNKIDRDYLTFALTCERQIRVFATRTEGTLIERMAVKADVFQLCKIIVPPAREAQERIARTLNAVRNEITLLKQLVEKYRIQKRGLMQKLLTGKWRVKI